MKYSILIPAYKANYLEECIKSILSQTYEDYELIIVDDASPEDLKSIVNKFADSRINYYRNENNCGAINVVDNWNICLNYSKGEYVICMGDDDKLLPNCLEEYNKLMSIYPGLNVYHGWTEIIDEKSNVYKMQEARPLWEGMYSMMWHRFKGRRQYIGDFLYKSSFLKNNNGFYKLPLAWGSDDITAYIASINKGIANTQTPVFQYRENAISITNSGNIPLKIKSLLSVREWCIEIMNNLEPCNNIEKIFKEMLLNNLDIYISHTLSLYISCDLKNSNKLKRLFFWINNKKNYQVSYKNILVGFLKSIYP